MGRKRGCSTTAIGDKASKRMCMEVNVIDNEDSQFPSDKCKQDIELYNDHKTTQYRDYFPYQLIEFMYQLDLLVLCSFRKFMYEYKYPSLLLSFGDSEFDKFNNILYYNEKSLYIQIEYVDKFYIDNDISYTRLFTKEKEKQSFFISSYFDSFAKCLISKLDSSLDIEYLIIYTNSRLSLTEEKRLKQGRSRNFYPFKFDIIDIKKYDILKDFLFTNDNAEERDFYKFSSDKMTRNELLKRLEFSSAVQKIMKQKNLSKKFEIEVKELFLDKLVFAVNQPNREELNSIVRKEIKENCKDHCDYITLQKEASRNLIASEKCKNSGLRIIYEFNLLMFFVHSLFWHKNISSINSRNHDLANSFIIHYKDKTIHIKAHHTKSNIGFSQLFPSRKQVKKNVFAINQHFALFIDHLKANIKYFIMYTNADLNLTEKKYLKKGKFKDFYPLKFESIDIQARKYKILRYFFCINEYDLYQFAQEETTRDRLFSLLELPPSLQKEKEEGSFSKQEEKTIKEKFLEKLIFAVNQPNRKKLNSIIKKKIMKDKEANKVPYNYEELHEIALRWSESHVFGPITKGIIEKLLEDVKYNKFSCQEIRNKNIDEEIKFARSVVGREGTPTFHQFLDFLMKGEGKKYLMTLKREGINIANMSSILNRAGNYAVEAFKGLYDLWFDIGGNKTQYLKILEKEGINLTNMSSILNGAGVKSPAAFKNLFNLLFDEIGNKTQYLNTLEKEGINLTNMSSILSGAGAKAPTAFQNLFNLWFDEKGNKTKYIKTLEKAGINLTNMSSILNLSGVKAATAFKDLYDLWFDEKGNKTQYLKTLEKEGINLANMSSILSGAGVKAPVAFKGLYDLWFDEEGNKTQYLKTLEKEGINLANVSSILSRAAANAVKAFKELYYLWFDIEGNKSKYLKTLEKEGISLTNMSSILHGAAANAVKASKELYSTLFDKNGNKNQHLKHFIGEKDEKKCFTVQNISSILNGTGANPKVAFEKLHNICFNSKGEKTKFLEDFYKAGFKASHLSCLLCGAGIHASSILKRLHYVCFNDQGKKTKLLDDFYNAGFMPGDICNILSGAADSLQKFHSFCFTEETKKYLSHFLNEEEFFTLNGLCNILHGARAKVCSALKDFYNVCLDDMGNKTEILDDFYEVGFMPNDLSHILSMTGSNAALVLRNFHKSCFNKNNHLIHFLAEEKLFTSKDLSNILHGVGINTCTTFKKLHNLCFDDEGNKTKYLKNIIKNHQDKMLDILYEKVRKGSSTCLDDISLLQ